MSDITKCPGDGCPIRDKCYRYTAPESEWQSKWILAPGYYVLPQKTDGPITYTYHPADWECDEYLPVKWEPKARAE